MPGIVSSPEHPRHSATSSSWGRLAIDAVVPKAEAPDVRKVGYAVWIIADRNPADQLSVSSIHHGYRAVVTVGVPQLGAIGRELEHVGATANLPRVGYLAGREVYNRDAAIEAVGYVQGLSVLGRIQAVRPLARWDERGLPHGLGVDDVHAAEVSPLVCHVEHRAVGRELDVHRFSADFNLTRDLHHLCVHLRHHPAPLAAGEQVVAVG